jgi:hypothetical protein
MNILREGTKTGTANTPKFCRVLPLLEKNELSELGSSLFVCFSVIICKICRKKVVLIVGSDDSSLERVF